jgi:hypothetical protein
MQLLIGLGFIAAAFAVAYAVIKGFVLLTGLHPAALAVPLGILTMIAWASSESK